MVVASVPLPILCITISNCRILLVNWELGLILSGRKMSNFLLRFRRLWWILSGDKTSDHWLDVCSLRSLEDNSNKPFLFTADFG